MMGTLCHCDNRQVTLINKATNLTDNEHAK